MESRRERLAEIRQYRIVISREEKGVHNQNTFLLFLS